MGRVAVAMAQRLCGNCVPPCSPLYQQGSCRRLDLVFKHECALEPFYPHGSALVAKPDQHFPASESRQYEMGRLVMIAKEGGGDGGGVGHAGWAGADSRKQGHFH